jgi:hypothetical protein
MSSKKLETKTDYRNAISGQFTTKRWARNHPDNFVKERNPVGHKPSKPKGR